MTVSHPCSITLPQMLSREADAHGTGCLALSLKWEEPKTWGLKWGLKWGLHWLNVALEPTASHIPALTSWLCDLRQVI